VEILEAHRAAVEIGKRECWNLSAGGKAERLNRVRTVGRVRAVLVNHLKTAAVRSGATILDVVQSQEDAPLLLHNLKEERGEEQNAGHESYRDGPQQHLLATPLGRLQNWS
jgi:hypothetical protein